MANLELNPHDWEDYEKYLKEMNEKSEIKISQYID